MVAIKTTDLRDFKRVADRIVQGETVVISRPRNENIVMITEKEYNELDDLRKKTRKENLKRFKQNMEAIQKQSVINGTDTMTMEEIDDIVAEVSQENRSKQ